jgi:hypothetical protein
MKADSNTCLSLRIKEKKKKKRKKKKKKTRLCYGKEGNHATPLKPCMDPTTLPQASTGQSNGIPSA